MRKFECKYCETRFLRKQHMQNHILRLHNNESNFNSDSNIIKDSLVSQGSQLSNKNVNKIQDFKCKFCLKQFLSKMILDQHQLQHEKKYKCKFCNKRFGQKGNLLTHENIHKKLKPYQCFSCNKAFRTSSHLKEHKKSLHDKIRSHQCQQCEMKFSRAFTLKQHIKFKHSGDVKHYKCKFCIMRYKEKRACQKHEKKHENQLNNNPMKTQNLNSQSNSTYVNWVDEIRKKFDKNHDL